MICLLVARSRGDNNVEYADLSFQAVSLHLSHDLKYRVIPVNFVRQIPNDNIKLHIKFVGEFISIITEGITPTAIPPLPLSVVSRTCL